MSRRPERYPLEQLDRFLSKINQYGRTGVTVTELRRIAGSAINLRRWVKAMTEDEFIYTTTDSFGEKRFKKTDDGEDMARNLRTDRALWKLNRYLGKRLRPKGFLWPHFRMLREKIGRGPVENKGHPEVTS
jgi:hypothetical protein